MLLYNAFGRRETWQINYAFYRKYNAGVIWSAYTSFSLWNYRTHVVIINTILLQLFSHDHLRGVCESRGMTYHRRWSVSLSIEGFSVCMLHCSVKVLPIRCKPLFTAGKSTYLDEKKIFFLPFKTRKK